MATTAIVLVDVESKSVSYYVSDDDLREFDGINSSADSNEGLAFDFIAALHQGLMQECDSVVDFATAVANGAHPIEVWYSGVPYI